MSKGEDTARAILRRAVLEASKVGLTHLTIGGLATASGMSKSGLYAHFGSKEQLQLGVLDFAADHFREVVVVPALEQPAGVAQLRVMVERWMGWDGDADYALPGGCIYVGAPPSSTTCPTGRCATGWCTTTSSFWSVSPARTARP